MRQPPLLTHNPMDLTGWADTFASWRGATYVRAISCADDPHSPDQIDNRRHLLSLLPGHIYLVYRVKEPRRLYSPELSAERAYRYISSEPEWAAKGWVIAAHVRKPFQLIPRVEEPTTTLACVIATHGHNKLEAYARCVSFDAWMKERGYD